MEKGKGIPFKDFKNVKEEHKKYFRLMAFPPQKKIEPPIEITYNAERLFIKFAIKYYNEKRKWWRFKKVSVDDVLKDFLRENGNTYLGMQLFYNQTFL
jgi:hypothetical protein